MPKHENETFEERVARVKRVLRMYRTRSAKRVTQNLLGLLRKLPTSKSNVKAARQALNGCGLKLPSGKIRKIAGLQEALDNYHAEKTWIETKIAELSDRIMRAEGERLWHEVMREWRSAEPRSEPKPN
jgi:hypothetical protein